MYSIILCGGSGTRLWPLSRKNFPKQFLKLYSDKSLLQETFLRMREIMQKENIFFITNKDGLFNVYNQIKELEPAFDKKNIIVETESRNTAPAILHALKYMLEKVGIDVKEPIFVLPSDHYIGDKSLYIELLKNIALSINDNIGVIGITPKNPEIGYGYIKKGNRIDDYWEVTEFKEKPDLKMAKQYVESNNYFWNSGKYIFKADAFLKEMKKHAPRMYDFFNKDYDEFVKNFSKLPSISIDYALAEKSDKMVLFEGDFDWSDVGSFDSLANILDKNKDNNKREISINSKNIFSYSSGGKLIITSGVEGIIVVENNDSILIQKKGKSEDVKDVVKHLIENNYKEIEHDIIVQRPWGSYEILIDTPTYKVKKITVYPGAKLSLQSHKHRSEHWVIVKGVAGVVNGDEYIILNENESAYISSQSKHRLSNPGDKNLEIIEVQTGSYLGEDDIVRYDDIYDRLEKK
ncbi:MAG: mannose-1-phosphate guanylyltransferase/mannose-6-phosphate isomerase [Patescibacteria group bacterium]